jgi:hypothetical protein
MQMQILRMLDDRNKPTIPTEFFRNGEISDLWLGNFDVSSPEVTWHQLKNGNYSQWLADKDQKYEHVG